MAAVPNESGFILEVPLKRYCAQVKGEQFLPALVTLPSLSYSKWVVPVRWSVLCGSGCRWCLPPPPAGRWYSLRPNRPLLPVRAAGCLQKQSRFHSPKNFSPCIGLTGWPAVAALQEIQGFRQQLSFELVVHIEHIASAYDVALADFNRRRMHHRPGRF